MTLPRDQLLDGARDPAGLAPLVDQAELVLRTWQPIWSEFLDAPLQEEGLQRLNGPVSYTHLTLPTNREV